MKKYILFLITLFFFSCEKLLMEKQPNNKPKAIFDQIWTFVNEKYAFFEYKNIDWDKSYLKYSVKVKEGMSNEDLFQICSDMLYDLKDEHVNLVSKFNVSRNAQVFLDYPSNFNNDLLERNYFKGKTQQVGSFGYFDFKDVAYIRYRDFTGDVNDYMLNYVLDNAKTKSGLIIDVRNNGGGAVVFVDKIVSRFVTDTTIVGKERHKSGVKKDDFSSKDVKVSPVAKGTKYIDKPVVILTNRGCYSATNRFAAYMKGLPNVKLLGGKTGGGGGLPTSTEITNGWRLRVSGSQFYDKKGLNIENGVDPDIQIEMSKSDIDAGKDSILEKGFELIRTGRVFVSENYKIK
jgi:Peptidase family S41/Tricorn protease C1 domain